MRIDNRRNTDMRKVSIVRRYTKYSPGSVLISFGDTKVLCTASLENRVPPFLKDSGQGWLTAEYGMLPSATHTRTSREVQKGKPSGRTNEIQRLIGRSLRSIIDLNLIGERTINIDADVIQADGGTRTAAITGGMVALVDLVNDMKTNRMIKENPIKEFLAAVSVGIVRGEPMCDLCYEEDSKAQVDTNIVMTESGKIVEIQGTAEDTPFTQDELLKMLDMARSATADLIKEIKTSLFEPAR